MTVLKNPMTCILSSSNISVSEQMGGGRSYNPGPATVSVEGEVFSKSHI